MLQKSPEVPAILPPDAAVRHYLSRFPTAMLAAICGPDGTPCQLVATRDFNDLFHCMRAWPKELAPRWAWAAWAIDIGSAQDVLTLSVGNDLRHATRTGSRLNIGLVEAIAAVESAATRLGVQLASHSEVIARAGARVGTLDDALTYAKLDGELADFNKMYRQKREQARAAGRSFPSYQVARSRLIAAIGAAKASNTPLDWRAVLGE
jgi:hypothetical protein